MTGYLLRRLGWSIAALVLFVTAAFVLVEALPFDYATASQFGCPGCGDALRDELGLERPVLVRYGEFIGGLLTGSLGRSYAGPSVVETIVGAFTDRTRLVVLDHVSSQTAIVFPVEEVVLYESRLSSSGATYLPLARLPLGADEAPVLELAP